MNVTVLISLFALVTSACALLITFFSYRREKNKSNQDVLFKEKIEAYKELTGKAYKIVNSYFDIVHKVQHENNEPKKWNKKFQAFCPDYYEEAHDMKDALFTYIAIIPGNLFKEFEMFVNSSLLFVTSSAHGDSELISLNYDKLEELLNIVVDGSRNDLNVDKLNTKLSSRIK